MTCLLPSLLCAALAAAPADPVRDALLKQGYVAVPMTPFPKSNQRLVEMTVNGQKVKMLVDTGCTFTAIHTPLADRLKLVAVAKKDGTFPTGPQPVGFAAVERYAIGSLTDGYLTVGLTDMRTPGRVELFNDVLHFDGILGQDLLLKHAAHVDLAADTLYLRPPHAGAVKALAGKWVCTGGRTTEGPIEAERVAGISHEFDGDRVRMRTKVLDERLYFAVEPKEGLTRFTMYQAKADGPDAGKIFHNVAVYKQDGDTMTMCLQFNDPPILDWDKVPTDFKPAPGWAILQFRREKPAAKP